MPDWIAAVILGLVEGLTEFIPVSSTGHLLLTKKLLGLPSGFWDTFSVMIQLGAILAVVVIYFQRLWGVFVRLPSDPKARWFAASVVLSVIPSMAAAFFAHDFIKRVLFESAELICVMLILGGIILLFADRFAPAPKEDDAMQLSWKRTLGIGFCQCLAMVPGVSRSGATIVGGMYLGIDRRAAAEFSFFMAIPTMVGAFVLDFWENKDVLTGDNLGIIALGFVVSFVSGVVVVRTMLDFINRYGLAPYGWWRIAVGVIGLGVLALA
ncbi:MAG: undecaprenyl-diphosphate phosphatase [Pseudomonadota bacterium]|uniref:undecaprenyl-diphosphate phosphatase n=1 Tax=unclassified Phenylobacterium TaxID=2640670 RepID=UPI0006F9243E|nr:MULTISPECIES: undecaprenyl-diphosphate phosphatase [unclassified Phenylobacterium]KRB51083.1 UDP pyrophosphate phosphatase [Phenylobacterium sp. Root700]MBT9471595.1 undecaprenyl-diphosphate phosphatase [Phenylobacterium sp.]